MTTASPKRTSPEPASRGGARSASSTTSAPHYLLVASDRISAFDVVLSPGIPDKGKILTQLSNFWFRKFSDVENHLIETDVARFPEELRPDARASGRPLGHRPQVRGRPLRVRRARIPRGIGWAEYRKTGQVCGIRLPDGLREGDRLPEPIFTPATKAETGHDENISFETMARALPDGEAATAARPDALALPAGKRVRR